MKKRALTLLEIMIVIFLITLITGTIGYNMKGTLEKGRVFRSEQGKEQLHDLLLMALAEFGNAEAIAKEPAVYLSQMGIAKDPKGLVLDGWKQPFEIRVTKNKTDFSVISQGLERHKEKQRRQNASTSETEDEEN